jgi:hypothetical protein
MALKSASTFSSVNSTSAPTEPNSPEENSSGGTGGLTFRGLIRKTTKLTMSTELLFLINTNFRPIKNYARIKSGELGKRRK